MSLDIVIRGGTVVDGTGKKGRLADVGVKDGRIAEIGKLDPGLGDVEIDAEGKLVTPGFIDIHSHSDYTLLVDPRAVSQVSQGVTLEVIGNCGWGCCPIRDPGLSSGSIYGYGGQVPISWRSTAGYLACLETAAPAVNVAMLVPNGQLRLAAVGLADRPATSDELAKMKRLLEAGLEEGAIGYSTGLEYVTEAGATEAEVTELCRVNAAAGGLYAAHTRHRLERAAEAVEEAIRTAENAGSQLQVSHLLPRGGMANLERCVERVEAAKARELDIAFDQHTRKFGTTNLRIVIPPWAYEGGRDQLARRLADPAERERMKSFSNLIYTVGDWDRVVLFNSAAHPDWAGKSFGEMGRGLGRTPSDVVFDELLAEIDTLHRPMVLLHTYSEELLRETYRHSDCMVASDATALTPDGPLAGASFHGAYTWASWFFRRMVRELGVFSVEEALFKITGLPARTIGLENRGVLAVGNYADIAVFDQKTFGELGTTEVPSIIATGMDHVIVNGRLTWHHGQATGQRAGEVIRTRRK